MCERVGVNHRQGSIEKEQVNMPLGQRNKKYIHKFFFRLFQSISDIFNNTLLQIKTQCRKKKETIKKEK